MTRIYTFLPRCPPVGVHYLNIYILNYLTEYAAAMGTLLQAGIVTPVCIAVAWVLPFGVVANTVSWSYCTVGSRQWMDDVTWESREPDHLVACLQKMCSSCPTVYCTRLSKYIIHSTYTFFKYIHACNNISVHYSIDVKNVFYVSYFKIKNAFFNVFYFPNVFY